MVTGLLDIGTGVARVSGAPGVEMSVVAGAVEDGGAGAGAGVAALAAPAPRPAKAITPTAPMSTLFFMSIFAMVSLMVVSFLPVMAGSFHRGHLLCPLLPSGAGGDESSLFRDR
ncbi:hypothetical protein [Arthrobacter sp. NA-172]|uniref:hypothetical protein n=1 Tax=Arthrobacter sp. NA-172 TaxID=3367524 RepID=UPI00375462DE